MHIPTICIAKTITIVGCRQAWLAELKVQSFSSCWVGTGITRVTEVGSGAWVSRAVRADLTEIRSISVIVPSKQGEKGVGNSRRMRRFYIVG